MAKSSIKRRISAHTSWLGGIGMPLHFDLEKHHCSQLATSFFNVYIMHHNVTSTRCLNTDQLCYDPVEKKRNLFSAFFQTSWIWSGVDVLRSECNLSLSERDFFVLLYCNTQSYCIRERLVSLSSVWIIKVTLFFCLLICLEFLFALKIRQIGVKKI